MTVVAKKPMLPKVAESIRNCVPYPPGKPIEEVERELGISNILKLASNENPLGASPRALSAAQNSLKNVRLYPDANHYYLRKKISDQLGVSFEEIIVGNGSNEIIDFVVRGFCVPGDNVVSCASAFVAYRVCAQVHGVEYREPELLRPISRELDEIFELCDDRTRVIFLPNPNNPTGTYLDRDALKGFLARFSDKPVILVLDYAYWEYARAEDLPDPMELYREFPNILVTRTFSKIHGLAGLRIGYGVGHPEILDPLRKIKMPFNVTNMALAAAEAALDDLAHMRKSYEVNAQGMDFLAKEFNAMGLVVWPSQANFLLIEVEKDPKMVFEEMLKKGVILRPVGGYGLKKHLRISIGTMEENKRMLAALKECL